MTKQGMDAFFTREKANAGIEVPLYTAAGTKSEHSIQIRGVDSDLFRQAEAESKRDAMRIAGIESQEERSKAIIEAKLKLLAALVISWTFEQECTQANVIEFFRNAPQIADAVDQVASKRSLFFAQESSNSQPTQKQSSGSTKGRKARTKASDKV